MRSAIDRALESVVAQGHPHVAGAVTAPSGIVYEGAFGLAQTAARVPMRPDTVCRIASMTKLVTSIAVLMLVEEGRVELDAPFARYVPEFRQPPVLQSFDRATLEYTVRPAARPISVRQLLTHTAGYGYWFLDAELHALKGNAPPEHFNPPFLMHEPGTRFSYGVATDVLGKLVEPVTGEALEAFLERRIFAPLGMQSTSYGLPKNRARLAARYSRAEPDADLMELPLETVAEPPRGGGGLYSTAPDYLKLLRVLLNGGCTADGERLLAPATAAALGANQIGALPMQRQRTAAPLRSADFLFMNGTQRFGFGVLVEARDRPAGRNAGSYGWAGIFNTYFWVDPRAGLAAVLFMQTSPFSSADSIAALSEFERAVYASFPTLR